MGHPWFGSHRTFCQSWYTIEKQMPDTHFPLHHHTEWQTITIHTWWRVGPTIPANSVMQSSYCTRTNQCIAHCHQKTNCHRVHSHLWSTSMQSVLPKQNYTHWRKRSHHRPMANTLTTTPTTNQRTNHTYHWWIPSSKPTSTTYDKQPIQSTIQAPTDQIHAPNILCTSSHHPFGSHR